jgi:hypothetical protein
MADILDVEGIERWLDAALNASSALDTLVGDRIYNTQRPQGVSTYPLVMYAQHSPNVDREAVGNDVRILTRGDWLVKAITQGNDFGIAFDVMKAADDAIRGERGVVENIRIMGNKRAQIQKYTESINGVRFNHVFAIYTIWAHER